MWIGWALLQNVLPVTQASLRYKLLNVAGSTGNISSLPLYRDKNVRVLISS